MTDANTSKSEGVSTSKTDPTEGGNATRSIPAAPAIMGTELSFDGRFRRAIASELAVPNMSAEKRLLATMASGLFLTISAKFTISGTVMKKPEPPPM